MKMANGIYAFKASCKILVSEASIIGAFVSLSIIGAFVSLSIIGAFVSLSIIGAFVPLSIIGSPNKCENDTHLRLSWSENILNYWRVYSWIKYHGYFT